MYYFKGEDKGCNAQVGFRSGVRAMNLQRDGCLSDHTIQHEFLHSLGFYHQHSAPNRDDYVIIYRENIQQGTFNTLKQFI